MGNVTKKISAAKRPRLRKGLLEDGAEFYFYRKPVTRANDRSPNAPGSKKEKPLRVRKGSNKLG